MLKPGIETRLLGILYDLLDEKDIKTVPVTPTLSASWSPTIAGCLSTSDIRQWDYSSAETCARFVEAHLRRQIAFQQRGYLTLCIVGESVHCITHLLAK